MATQSYAGALAVLSVGGNSQLEFVENANFSFDEDTAEGAPASRFGGNVQGLKRSGKIDISLWSDQATDVRVSHLDLSAAAWGSLDLLTPNISSEIMVGIDFTHKMSPGNGDLWAFPIVADGKLQGSLRCGMDASDAPDLLLQAFSGVYADPNQTLTFTLNSVAYSFPFRATNHSIPVSKDGLMEFTSKLMDRSARSGVTILPSGTTSLIEKALNASKTALAFSFKPQSANSITIGGNMVFQSMQMSIVDGQLSPVKFSFATQGVITGV